MCRTCVESLFEAGVSFDDAITYHLTTNLYPPVPKEKLDDIKVLCRGALAIASLDYYESEMKDLVMALELPPCLINKDNGRDFMTVKEVIETYRIHDFIGKEQVYEN